VFFSFSSYFQFLDILKIYDIGQSFFQIKNGEHWIKNVSEKNIHTGRDQSYKTFLYVIDA
jgi:hypothetical protein